ncbi:MAG: preprotein translocase subunit SecY [Tissierellia bacterium]|nr:preprotein translocase subunit SecY [Tissierellia bacterium]
MLKTLSDAWRIPELRKKMMFTMLMLVIFRLGAAIPVPYIDTAAIKAAVEQSQGGLLQFLDMMGGGNFSQFSIFATNIYPYITASIVIQLLTVAFPKLGELAKEGETGRKKIGKYTRYLAIALAALQSFGYIFGVFSYAVNTNGEFLKNLVVMLSLVGGSSFLIWLGDIITERGIGNGISLLIFTGIVSRIPHSMINSVRLIGSGERNPIPYVVFVILMLIVIAFVVRLQEGERRVSVQYAKRMVGRKMYGGQSTHIPIKVSMSGVMPVIFANTIMSIPQTIAMFMKRGSAGQMWITKYLTPQGQVGVWIYTILSFFLILFFAYFYTAIQFNTVEYAKNLQQNGGFIPGIRPGRPTSDYLSKIVSRITFVGGLSLAILASLPVVFEKVLGLGVSFTGTGIIIMVGVAIETVKQLEAQMLMRHYKGFLS